MHGVGSDGGGNAATSEQVTYKHTTRSKTTEMGGVLWCCWRQTAEETAPERTQTIHARDQSEGSVATMCEVGTCETVSDHMLAAERAIADFADMEWRRSLLWQRADLWSVTQTTELLYDGVDRGRRTSAS